MTAARRGQKAVFPQLPRPASRNFPSGAVRPPFSPTSTIPANAASVPPSCAPTSSGRVVGQGVTMQSVEK